MGGLNSGPHRSGRLREDRAKRFDALKWQMQAKAENWPEGIRQTLAFRAPHTGAEISARVALTFTDERFGGRRVWFSCPNCQSRARYLFGGRPHITKPHQIACAACQRLVYESRREGPERRLLRQMGKLEGRLGGDPRKLAPPKGLARRTFDRLARRHEIYRQKLITRREIKLQNKLRRDLRRSWSTNPAELSALRRAYGLK